MHPIKGVKMNPVFKAIYNAIIYFPLIILVAGILLGIIKWRRHPLISGLAIFAFLFRLFLDWVSPYTLKWIQGTLQASRISPYLWINYYMGWYLLRAVFMATSYILIIVSIFLWRKPQQKGEEIAAGNPSAP
jgi:hypothetical protein